MLDAWVHGWAISRSTAAPVKIPGGYRIDVGLPGNQVRYVLPTYDACLVDGLGQPDTWLKICGQVALGPPWQVQPAEHLMTARLSPTPVTTAPPYQLETVQQGSIIEMLVRAGGVVAARGKAALTGDAAVFDQIETDPQHRRRGLGRTVMNALSASAQYAGATTGVLVATEDGRALYTALGWTLHSSMTAAVSRG